MAITETFREALMLSNKTYFLEEMSKQKGIQKELKKEVNVYKERIKTQEQQIQMYEAQIMMDAAQEGGPGMYIDNESSFESASPTPINNELMKKQAGYKMRSQFSDAINNPANGTHLQMQKSQTMQKKSS